jgi:amidase
VGRLYIEGTAPAIDQALDEALRRAGFRVVRLNEEFTKAWVEARKHGQVIAVADGYESHRHLLKEGGITATTKAALILGNLEHDTKAYDEAMRQRPGRIATFEARVLGIQNTVPVNYAGNPALVIPIPVNDKRVPVTSLQLIGPNKSEAKLLNAARILASSVHPSSCYSPPSPQCFWPVASLVPKLRRIS